jgi:hypothetical protein
MRTLSSATANASAASSADRRRVASMVSELLVSAMITCGRKARITLTTSRSSESRGHSRATIESTRVEPKS